MLIANSIIPRASPILTFGCPLRSAPDGAVLVKLSRGGDCPCPFGPRRLGSHIDREAKPADCSTRVGDWLVHTLGCSALGCIEAQVARCGLGVGCGPRAGGGRRSPNRNDVGCGSSRERIREPYSRCDED